MREKLTDNIFGVNILLLKNHSFFIYEKKTFRNVIIYNEHVANKTNVQNKINKM